MLSKNNLIRLKNKDNLIFNDFIFKCSIGKNGLSSNKVEGNKKTPKGIFSLGCLYYRNDRVYKPKTKLKCLKISRLKGWSNDVRNEKYYNKIIKIRKKIRHEKLFRKDYKYDYFIPILYNTKQRKIGKGSAIFIHLTKNYKSTAGCIALNKKDFLILLKLINKKTKIKIF